MFVQPETTVINVKLPAPNSVISDVTSNGRGRLFRVREKQLLTIAGEGTDQVLAVRA
jgi:hypothetical protein